MHQVFGMGGMVKDLGKVWFKKVEVAGHVCTRKSLCYSSLVYPIFADEIGLIVTLIVLYLRKHRRLLVLS